MSDPEAILSQSLQRDVEQLAGRIGHRNAWCYVDLCRAADYTESRFRESGYAVSRHTFEMEGQPYHNLEVEIRGSEEIVLVGAHYDSVGGSPGANDNASGVAAVLALAERLAKSSPKRTLRFVAFVNEEPPFFQTSDMGSRAYARRCRDRGEKIVAMISIETIGYYSDVDGSQSYPPPLSFFYPSKGNFIGFVGNLSSRALVRRVLKTFRENAKFPSEGAVLPSWIAGVGWSDHWSFWEESYPAVMVTDTAPFRYPYYHTPQDTPDKVDFDRCARVVAGLEHVIRELVD